MSSVELCQKCVDAFEIETGYGADAPSKTFISKQRERHQMEQHGGCGSYEIISSFIQNNLLTSQKEDYEIEIAKLRAST